MDYPPLEKSFNETTDALSAKCFEMLLIQRTTLHVDLNSGLQA
jgi:hypothetical protein